MPNPILVFINFWFISLWLPEDDFIKKLQKVVAGILGLTPPFALAYIGYCTWLIHQNRYVTSAAIFLAVCILFFIVPGVSLCIYVQCTKRVNTTLLMVTFVPIEVGLLFVGLCIPYFPTIPIQMGILILVVISRAKYTPVLISLGSLGMIHAVYNGGALFTDTPDSAVLAFPDHLVSTPVEITLQHILGCMFSWIMLAAIAVQSDVHDKSLKAAKRNTLLANEVVALLRKYDTDGVSAALKRHSGEADEDLVEAFKAMNANLEMYRPFLPNYMFVPSSSGEEEDSPSMADSSTDGNVTEIISSGNQENRSLNTSANPLQPRSRGGSGPGLSPEELESSAFRLPSGGNIFALSRNVSSSTELELSLPHRAVSHKARITLAVVDCHTSVFEERSGSTRSYNLDKLEAFVDMIYASANGTHAAVHSMLGDRALISWNAVSRAIQPELKACRFLCKLRTAAEFADVSLAATACSGSADCNDVVAKTRQQVGVVHADWQPLLENLFETAKRYRTILIDEPTQDVGQYEAETIAVDRYNFCLVEDSGTVSVCSNICDPQSREETDTKGQRSAIVYELLGEKTFREDEWMYQVGSGDASVKCALTTSQAAVAAAAAKNFHEAVVKLSPLVSRSSSPSSSDDGAPTATSVAEARLPQQRSKLLLRLYQFCREKV